TLDGYGVRYAVDRTPGSPRDISLPLDSIALLEANRRRTVSRFAMSGLSVWTVLSTGVVVMCTADPKACFGSCPTFYLEDGASEELVAEGFSSSIARVLEERDVDMLPVPAGPGRDYSLLMRNEAPETHAVRWLRLLAVPRTSGRSVYLTTQGGFREGSPVLEPTVCRADGMADTNGCTSMVRAPDGFEYFSSSDSLDLATRELVELEFPNLPVGEEVGILIRGRASLLSTFLFYQSIAYLGEDAGEWLAALERGDPGLASRVMGLPRALGTVDVLMKRGEEWEEVGSFGEAGPIASDEQVVGLGTHPGGPVRVRLRMAKGAWRIDRVGLVQLGETLEPLVLHPTGVEPVSGDTPDEVALSRLLDPNRHLVTQRGDAYRIHFRLPANEPDLALFLDSRGYYYEWMRGEWAGEENPAMAALIFSDPEAALRRMAPTFKAREAGMEETFWSSRFRRRIP
ncbi:MAG: hypothetical protein KAJ42_11755, partial [Gemmatimonadetes bacterium]|nr:hypothetical protein [Gemmatimonadota bacterium]